MKEMKGMLAVSLVSQSWNVIGKLLAKELKTLYTSMCENKTGSTMRPREDKAEIKKKTSSFQ